MKYIALLRGINVGGNNLIKMTDLKKSVEKCGFSNVSTYIQSGNILFETNEQNQDFILTRLETQLNKDFNYKLLIVLKNLDQFNKILSEVPSDWKTHQDLRCYIAFLSKTASSSELLSEIELNEGVDFLQAGEGVLYMTTLLSGLTRSRFTKLVSREIYKQITIRNYTTSRKLLDLIKA